MTIPATITTVMRRTNRILPHCALYWILTAACPPTAAFAQTALTWQQVKDRFAAANPTLKAAQLNIDEARAAEITAYLRPNPSFTFSTDGTQIAPYDVNGIWRPFAGTQFLTAFAYLHERDHKRSCGVTKPRSPPS